MLARAAASRRAATIALRSTPRVASRHIPVAARSISFWTFRRRPDPTLPVFFPRENTPPRQTTFWKIRYAAFTILVYYALWQIYMSVVLDPLLDWAEAEWDSMSEKERQHMEEQADDEEDEPIFFLPFPFTTKQIAQPPYKGTDPEWQEFLKVNKDPQKQSEIKSALAEKVRRGVDANPGVVRLMGGKSTKVKKMWLDIIYPPVPPPKHYISGLILDWDGLFWGDRSIESLAAHQLDAIVYPKAVALAAWAFWNTLIHQTKADIAKALGFDGPKEPETSWQSIIINRGKEQAPFGTAEKPSPPNILAPPNPQTRAPQPGSMQGPPELAGIFRKPGEGDVPMSASVMTAIQAASLTLAKNWRPVQQPVTRGCIRVDGLIELQGKSAVMVVYVLAYYDPKAKQYMNVQTKLKHLVQTKQRPAGGR